MALLKRFEYQNGTYSEYHKITAITLSPQEEKYAIAPSIEELENMEMPQSLEMATVKNYNVRIRVSSFVSQEIRNENIYYVVREEEYSHVFSQENFNTVDIFKTAYSYLKTLDVFSDAIDV